MSTDTANRRSYLHRLLQMVLSVALVFTLFHVASHGLELDVAGGDASECEVCRLNHMPADLPLVSVPAVPLFLLSLLLIVSVFRQPTLHLKHILGARAPPF